MRYQHPELIARNLIDFRPAGSGRVIQDFKKLILAVDIGIAVRKAFPEIYWH
jgi:hypothetical protein